MNHLFLPYPLALIAKEKGFNEPCIACYTQAPNWMKSKEPIIKGHFVNTFKEYFNSQLKPENVAAPLYQQIIDWLREKNLKIIEVPNGGWGIHLNYGGTYIENRRLQTLDKAIEEALKLT